MKMKTSMVVLVGALTLAVSQVSFAALLPTNSTIVATGAAVPVGATLVADTGPVAFTSATFSGTLETEVFTNDSSNPNGLTGLTFTYLLTNSAGSTDPLERLTVGSFAGITVFADYQTPTTGQVPTDFTRTASGSVIGADFIPPNGLGTLAVGGTAALIVLQTNATGFTNASASVIDDSTANVATYAPASGTPTPEPTTALLSVPAVALLLRRRRR